MGIIVQANQQELHPVGEYLLQITGNGLSKKGNGKITMDFQFAEGPLKGKTIRRNCNPTVSPNSDLGKLLMAAGVNVAAIPPGQQFDLDIMNGKYVWGTLTHYNNPAGGTTNSLTTFRSVAGTGVPAAPAAAAPAQAYVPLTQAPAQTYVPPKQPAPAPAQTTYVPPTTPQTFVPPQQTASAPSAPVAGATPAKINF